MRRPECERPRLDELEHFVADIFVRGVLDELRVSFTIRLVGDFFVDGRAAVLDGRLEHHQGVESSVRVRREHLLLDLLDRVFWPGNDEIIICSSLSIGSLTKHRFVESGHRSPLCSPNRAPILDGKSRSLNN